jgi:hypothetical protein
MTTIRPGRIQIQVELRLYDAIRDYAGDASWNLLSVPLRIRQIIEEWLAAKGALPEAKPRTNAERAAKGLPLVGRPKSSKNKGPRKESPRMRRKRLAKERYQAKKRAKASLEASKPSISLDTPPPGGSPSQEAASPISTPAQKVTQTALPGLEPPYTPKAAPAAPKAKKPVEEELPDAAHHATHTFEI